MTKKEKLAFDEFAKELFHHPNRKLIPAKQLDRKAPEHMNYYVLQMSDIVGTVKKYVETVKGMKNGK